MTDKHLVTGRLGEEIAVKYLRSKGFTVIEQNYRKKWGEIDVICETGSGCIHFIEVKSTQSAPDNTYSPLEHVDSRKLSRLRRAIETYIDEKALSDKEVQLDVLAVYINEQDRRAVVEHIEDIAS